MTVDDETELAKTTAKVARVEGESSQSLATFAAVKKGAGQLYPAWKQCELFRVLSDTHNTGHRSDRSVSGREARASLRTRWHGWSIECGR